MKGNYGNSYFWKNIIPDNYWVICSYLTTETTMYGARGWFVFKLRKSYFSSSVSLSAAEFPFSPFNARPSSSCFLCNVSPLRNASTAAAHTHTTAKLVVAAAVLWIALKYSCNPFHWILGGGQSWAKTQEMSGEVASRECASLSHSGRDSLVRSHVGLFWPSQCGKLPPIHASVSSYSSNRSGPPRFQPPLLGKCFHHSPLPTIVIPQAEKAMPGWEKAGFWNSFFFPVYHLNESQREGNGILHPPGYRHWKMEFYKKF